MHTTARITGVIGVLCVSTFGGLVTAAAVPATAQPATPTVPEPTNSQRPADPFSSFTPAPNPGNLTPPDARTIADAQQRIAELEAASAAAASRAQASAAQVAQSRERLALFTRHVEATRAELVTEQRTLASMARELYVNGGVQDAALTFALDDPDSFVADLDRLVVTGTRQNTVLVRARERALSLKSTQLAQAREAQRLQDAAAAQARDQAAADAALTDSREVLAELVAAEERRVAQEQARAALDAAIREAEAVAEEWRRVTAAATAAAEQSAAALAAGQNSTPAGQFPASANADAESTGTATTPAATEDLSQYTDSAAWADSAKSMAVKMCESGNNYSTNTGNGYYGAWQFDYPSWHDNGGGMFAEYPHQATKAQQDYIAWTYWRKAGWRPWECG
ncbi:MAG: resuscitation-promoting factor RpfB [Actinomycetota bacterium]|nr:resuscitation-promoting factor RpfB [Actinomycetota bacterium]